MAYDTWDQHVYQDGMELKSHLLNKIQYMTDATNPVLLATCKVYSILGPHLCCIRWMEGV